MYSQRKFLHAGVFHSPLLIVCGSFLLLEIYIFLYQFQVYNIVIRYFYRLYSISSYYKMLAVFFALSVTPLYLIRLYTY